MTKIILFFLYFQWLFKKKNRPDERKIQNNCEQKNSENLEKVKEVRHVEWDERKEIIQSSNTWQGKDCELNSLGNGKPLWDLRVRMEMPEPQKESFEHWQ